MDSRNNNNNNQINIQYLENSITNIQEKLPAILDDFKKYYIFYNKTPTYSEYQTIFENLKSNLNSINSELITISNNVNISIQNISDQLLKLNNLIEKEKTKNMKLKSNSYNLNNKYNGSKELVNEYKQIYDNKYLRNVSIFIGIIVSSILLYKFFTPRVDSKSITNVV